MDETLRKALKEYPIIVTREYVMAHMHDESFLVVIRDRTTGDCVNANAGKIKSLSLALTGYVPDVRYTGNVTFDRHVEHTTFMRDFPMKTNRRGQDLLIFRRGTVANLEIPRQSNLDSKNGERCITIAGCEPFEVPRISDLTRLISRLERWKKNRLNKKKGDRNLDVSDLTLAIQHVTKLREILMKITKEP